MHSRAVDSVRADAKNLSSRIYERIGVAGKVTRPGPLVALCEGKPEDEYFRIRHSWSFYEAPADAMHKAMHRLKDKLPEDGWRVRKYGRDSSAAHSLEIVAHHPEKEFAVNITFQDRRGRSESPSSIEVVLESACFHVPEGDDAGEY
jgi:hypothetical protein